MMIKIKDTTTRYKVRSNRLLPYMEISCSTDERYEKEAILLAAKARTFCIPLLLTPLLCYQTSIREALLFLPALAYIVHMN